MKDNYIYIKEKIEMLSLTLNTTIRLSWDYSVGHKKDTYASAFENFKIHADDYEAMQVSCLSHLLCLDHNDFIAKDEKIKDDNND